MAIYKWARYSVNATKKWDTTKTATGKKSSLGAGVHACYAKNLTELGNMINVDDGQIHWNQESAFSSFGQAFDLSWYYAGNDDSIRTHSSKTFDTGTYYAIITNKTVFLSANVTCDIYKISNVRWEYSRGSFVDYVTSTNQSAYPTDGKSGDYWYVYTAVSNTVTAVAGTGISTATVQKLTNLLPAAVAAGTGGCTGYWGGSVGYTTKDGYQCISITNNTGNQYDDGMISGGASLTAGKQYIFSGMINAPSGKGIRLGMRMTGGGNSENIVITGTGSWQYFEHSFTASTGMTGELECVEGDADSTSQTWYVRSLLIAEMTAGASSVDAFVGDALYFVASKQSGYTFTGWWNGSARVYSSSCYRTELTSAANLTLTATAEETTHTPLYVKVGGTYTPVVRVFKKISGNYVLQTDIQALFPAGIKLRKE